MSSNSAQTLTAYKIKIGVWRSNQNAFKEELKNKHENGEDINASLDHLLYLFANDTDGNTGKDADYVIKFEDVGESIDLPNGFRRTSVSPNSGRKDRNTTMYNVSSRRQKQQFDMNWVATHPKNIFFYEKDGEIYAAFHRIGGSGCKSVFMQIANELLKKEGLAMQMDLMISSAQNDNIHFVPDSITLVKQETARQSTDLSDQINGGSKKRKQISRQLTLRLKGGFNPSISNAFRSLASCSKSKEEVYEIIRENISDFDQYDVLKVQVKLGNVTRVVNWDEIEKLIDGYDITEKLKTMSGDEMTKLIACADDYMFNIVKIGE